MIDYINEIKVFESYVGYKKEGTIIQLQVKATLDGKIIYDDVTECCFSYEVGYMQQVVEIDWNVNNDVMAGLGLHSRYNTNFQKFKFDNQRLIIRAGDVVITMEKAD